MINLPRAVAVALILLSLSIVTACGPDGGGSSAFTFSGDGDPPPLEFELEVPAAVRAGDITSLLLRVRNSSDAPLNLFSAVPPHEFEIRDSSGELVWSSLMAEVIDPHTKESYLLPGFRVSLGGFFDFEPHEEVVLDAEWDTTTISQEAASPGVYFVSAIVAGDDADDRDFRLSWSRL